MGQENSRFKRQKSQPKQQVTRATAATAMASLQATPASSLPDTITGAMLQNCQRLGSAALGQVWRYDAHTVLKRSGPSPTAEAAAMRFVREHTSIPVPKVLKSDANGYIFMEYVDGQPLDQAWERLNSVQRKGIVDQLRGCLGELHAVSGSFIGSVDRSICNDQLFENCESPYGPYADEAAFRKGMAQSLRACGADPTWTDVVIGFIDAIPTGRRIVLTHGDFVPRNILVRDGRVVAIVDWEMAGFYPEYWEYAKAHFFADYQHPWMRERVLDQIMTPFKLELGLLLHTRKVFLEF
ncbi:kinase-like domain-containing protein [Apodospora peruviana]|uniref:Kinase-like domain-containing protein n=1 Tax=Apodospora peruviana TaxID=516989 RepID=A0AAE0M819_9PEZI|nr:kinase-like domain-containing protein [Apodospora peruviana]